MMMNITIGSTSENICLSREDKYDNTKYLSVLNAFKVIPYSRHILQIEMIDSN